MYVTVYYYGVSKDKKWYDYNDWCRVKYTVRTYKLVFLQFMYGKTHDTYK